MKSVMGLDQYGTSYHDLGKHPRKELLRRLGATKAEKIYVDPDGKHIGYVINKLWITLYSVGTWRSKDETPQG